MWAIFIRIFKLLLSFQASDVYQLELSTSQRELSAIFEVNIVLFKERRKVADGAVGGWKWSSVIPPTEFLARYTPSLHLGANHFAP